eukprot:scaffold1459_cov260-Pinguiococcus_pyrenoidosus.AAC.10
MMSACPMVHRRLQLPRKSLRSAVQLRQDLDARTLRQVRVQGGRSQHGLAHAAAKIEEHLSGRRFHLAHQRRQPRQVDLRVAQGLVAHFADRLARLVLFLGDQRDLLAPHLPEGAGLGELHIPLRRVKDEVDLIHSNLPKPRA